MLFALIYSFATLGDAPPERHQGREPEGGFARFFHIWVALATMVTINARQRLHSIAVQRNFPRAIAMRAQTRQWPSHR